ncbi:hypothetical protein HDU96_003089 [Phlyctochytrium bullatum]|nr:hypothetical protein HDU96_003089 [Phlyctochytrium bullatum]
MYALDGTYREARNASRIICNLMENPIPGLIKELFMQMNVDRIFRAVEAGPNSRDRAILTASLASLEQFALYRPKFDEFHEIKDHRHLFFEYLEDHILAENRSDRDIHTDHGLVPCRNLGTEATLKETATAMMLKVAEVPEVDQLITMEDLMNLSIQIQDPLQDIQLSLFEEVKKGLTGNTLPRRYSVILMLAAFEQDAEIRKKGLYHLSDLSQRFIRHFSTTKKWVLLPCPSKFSYNPTIFLQLEESEANENIKTSYLRADWEPTQLAGRAQGEGDADDRGEEEEEEERDDHDIIVGSRRRAQDGGATDRSLAHPKGSSTPKGFGQLAPGRNVHPPKEKIYDPNQNNFLDENMSFKSHLGHYKEDY